MTETTYTITQWRRFSSEERLGILKQHAAEANDYPRKEIDPMGRIMVEATIENLHDLWEEQQGRMQPDQVRRVTVKDALVDTGATLLSLPTSLIHQLGLAVQGKRRVTSSLGVGEAAMYEAVRLTIQGRTCTMDVMEVPDSVPALIGQLPLEHLDFVIDPKKQALIGNPAHGGALVYEMY